MNNQKFGNVLMLHSFMFVLLDCQTKPQTGMSKHGYCLKGMHVFSVVHPKGVQ